MSLAETQEQLTDDVKDLLTIIAAKHPAAELGREYEQVEEGLRVIAICNLLIVADARKFQNQLVLSAFARRHFLLRCIREYAEPGLFHARSRSEAVFCALAAGDPALALEVAELSPKAVIVDGEYPDDFAYHKTLQLFLAGSAPDALTEQLAEYERSLDGARDERLAICRALAEQSAAEFERAFADLLMAQSLEVDELRPSNQDRPAFEPQARIFVEGLAILRLAELRGIAPAQAEYPPLCPSLARVPAATQRPDDIFSELV